MASIIFSPTVNVKELQVVHRHILVAHESKRLIAKVNAEDNQADAWFTVEVNGEPDRCSKILSEAVELYNSI